MIVSVKRKSAIYVFAAFSFSIIYAAALFGTRFIENVPNTFILGATLDLTITVPALFYLFVIRKQRSGLLFFPAALVSFVLASLVLPGEHHDYLDILFYGLMAVEALFAAIIVFTVWKTVRHFRTATEQSDPFPERLYASITASLGDQLPAMVLASEISMFYYLFASRKQLHTTQQANAYSYHEKSGYLGILIMIVHVFVLEGIGIHMLLTQWGHALAWISSGMNLYTIVYLISDYKATKRTPIVVSDSAITLRIGFRKKLVIPVSSIQSLKTGSTSFNTDRKRKDVFLGTALLSMEEPKVEIELNAPIETSSPLGKRQITKVYLSVDDHQKFASHVQGLL